MRLPSLCVVITEKLLLSPLTAYSGKFLPLINIWVSATNSDLPFYLPIITDACTTSRVR